MAGENNLIFSSLYDRIVGAWIEGKTHIKGPGLNNMPHFKTERHCRNIITVPSQKWKFKNIFFSN